VVWVLLAWVRAWVPLAWVPRPSTPWAWQRQAWQQLEGWEHCQQVSDSLRLALCVRVCVGVRLRVYTLPHNDSGIAQQDKHKIFG
jgi:hypothetical protein